MRVYMRVDGGMRGHLGVHECINMMIHMGVQAPGYGSAQGHKRVRARLDRWRIMGVYRRNTRVHKDSRALSYMEF